MKYTDILSENSRLEKHLQDERYSIKVLSNIVVNQLDDILEYYSRRSSIPAVVSFGEYDNIVQDSIKLMDENLVIIFWELANLIDGLQYRSEILSNDDIRALEEKTFAEIKLVFDSLADIPLVLFNRFSSLVFSHNAITQNQLDILASRLNSRIEGVAGKNIHLVDTDKVIAMTGIQNCVDFRYYYLSKALYTVDFFQSYVKKVLPFIRSASGLIKKAIIFDCDNTLWKGVVAEDGFENIKLSSSDRVGAIFSEIQGLALSLKKNHGVILGLCSKNNLADVDKVLDEHPDMLIRNKDLVIKKINWNDKVSSLKEISHELNIGLDSIVFVDDSDFETELIKKSLPEITVLKVPSKVYEYPSMLRDNLGLFFSVSQSDEDQNKTQLYKQQAMRASEEKKIGNIDDYLSSLGLTLKVYIDDASRISRIAQISQKTNQFNLTTIRYTELEVTKLVSDDSVKVVSIGVSDKFGDNGITGLCVLKFDRNKKVAKIDTLLMSCRVLGRNIEYAFMDVIADLAIKENVMKIYATYMKTAKNEQVCDFYERCGLEIKDKTEALNRYVLDVNNYKRKNLKYIEVVNE
jgi:FkbH-like protein